MVCYYCDIFDYIATTTPLGQHPVNQLGHSVHDTYSSAWEFLISLVAITVPPQVSAVTMSLIVSCDLLSLAVIQVVS